MRILALVCLIFWACESLPERILEVRFPKACWIYPDTVWGSLTVVNPPLCKALELRIELEETYPWRNLYLLLWLEAPDGFRERSRLEVVFSDTLGRWYASNRKFQTFILPKASFASRGRYRIGILPYIRSDTVNGIRRIALYAHPCREE
ncbi:MAG: hypothetical protein RMK19_06365 [Bacteroidia bacterium]|nr:hypothetical protein [Bacteroidia bacterium]MDW8015617.1 hypothetical protein [Bacteroidia bacterium]